MAANRETLMQQMGGLDPMDAPIPGESLTSSPANPAPHERPPEHVTEKEAIEEIFFNMIEEETLDELLDLMRAEVPVDAIAQTVLFEGFRLGKFTPDLMLLLLEPTIYILLWLAEYAQIDPVLGEPDEDEDELPSEFADEVEDADVPNETEVTAASLLERLPESITLQSGQEIQRESLLTTTEEQEV